MTGLVGDDTFTLSGTANAFSGLGIAFTGFDTIAGNGGNDTVAGRGTNLCVTAGTPDAGSSNSVTWSQIKNISDSTGTVAFGTSGSVTGNITASTLDYGSYGSAVAFNLLGTSSNTTSGIGGTWSGVTLVNGNAANTGTVTGLVGDDSFTLSSTANAFSSSGIAFTGFDTIAGNGGNDTIAGTGQTYALTAGTPDAGSSNSVTWSQIKNISDSTGTVAFGTSGSVTGNITASTLDYGTYGSAVAFNLLGTSNTTSGIGGTWTGVTAVTGSSQNDTINGSGQTYALDNTVADKGSNGTVTWTSFENLNDSTGTVDFGTGGSVTGNITASALDYSSYGSAVAFNLLGTSGNATSGIGGTWAGVTAVTGNAANTGTVTGLVGDDTFTLSGTANAFSGSGIDFTGFDTITGNGGNDTIAGSGQTYALTVGTPDAGSSNSVTWSQLQNINDSTGTVNFGTNGSVTGNITASTLDYSTYGSAVAFNLLGTSNTTSGIGGTWTGVTAVTGSSQNDTINGSGQTYTLDNTVADKGSNGTVAWASFENLNDSTGTVSFGTGGSVTGNINANALDYSSYGSAVAFNLLGTSSNATSGIGGTWTGVTMVSGNAANTGTLTGLVGDDSFTLSGTANAFSGSGIAFTGFDTIVGNGGNDTVAGTGQTYTLTAGTPDAGSSNSVTWSQIKNISDSTGTVNFGTSGSVTGNVAVKTLDYGSYGSAVAFNLLGTSSNTTSGIGGTWTGVTVVNGNAANTGTVTGLVGDDTFTLSGTANAFGSSGITFTGFDAIVGNGGNDTIAGTGQTYALTAGTPDAGSSNSVTWSQIKNISDSTGTVDFGTNGSVTGNITASTLDYGSYGSAVAFNLLGTSSNTTSGIGGTWTGVTAVNGNAANTGTVTGLVGDDTFTLSGTATAFGSSGITFTGFDAIVGNGGNDTIAGAGQTYALTAGTPDAGSSNSVTWSQIKNISDSTGTVAFGTNGSVTGNITASTLDYGSYGSAVAFNLLGTSSNTTSGIGGTWTGVTLVNGNAANTGTVTGLVGDDTFTLSGTANVFGSSGITFTGFDAIVGNGGNDTIAGAGQTYALTAGTPDAGSSTGVTWSQVKNISDSTGTVAFGTSGSVTGNINAGALDYSTYGSAVAFNLLGTSGNATSGIGGTWTGVTVVSGNAANTGTVTGLAGNDTFTLSGTANAFVSSGVTFTGFDAIVGNGGNDTIAGTGQTYALTAGTPDAGSSNSVTWSQVKNISDSTGTVAFGTSGSVTGNITASTLDYSSYGSAVAFNLLGTSSNATSGIGGTWTGVTAVTGSSQNDTVNGSGQVYTLDNTLANKGSNGTVTWTSFENLNDATGTVDFGTGGSVTGNITASALDYSSYGSAVAFNLLGTSNTTSGIGGTWTGVTAVTGSGQSDTVNGSGQTYTLDNTVADKGSNGTVTWTSFENLNDSTGTVAFGTSGSVTGNVNAGTLDYSTYGSVVAFNLLGTSSNTTSGIGGTWTGVTMVNGNAANAGTVTGLAGDDTFTLSGTANAFGSSGIAFTGFDTIDGNGGNDTVAGTGQTYALTAGTPDAGSSNSVTWSQVKNISDSTGTVAFGTSGSVTGNITASTLDYSTYGSAVAFNLLGTSNTTTGIGGTWTGVTAVTGSSQSDTLNGSGQTYTLDNTVADKGSNGTVAWTSFENLNDGTGTVDFGTGGSVTGNVTASTLDYSSYGSAVAFNLLGTSSNATSGIGGIWTGVTAVTGSSQSDMINGSGQTYTLDNTVADKGSNGTVTWASFENLNDSTGTVAFGTSGSVTGNVNASALDYSSYGSAVAFNLLGTSSNTTSGIGGTWTGVTMVNGNAANAGTVTGLAGDDTFTLSGTANAFGSSGIAFTGFDTIAGNGGNDTIAGTGQTYALTAGTPDAGSSNSVTWSQIKNISDSTGTVAFGTSGSVTGNITASTLDYSSYGSAVAFNLLGTSSNATSGIGGTWTGVTLVNGNAANTGTVTGLVGDDTFTLSGTANAFGSSGITFTGFDAIVGNGGNDTIAGTGQTYALTAGTPDAGSSNSVTWSQIKNVSDSTGTVAVGTSGSVTGNVAVKTLDYSTYGSAVAFNLLGTSNTTSGIGGTWTGVTAVIGSGQSDTISGSGQTYYLTSMDAGNNGVVGWTSFENLDDSTLGLFVFSGGAGVSGTIAGGGAGTLDYSAYTTAVNVDLAGAATNIGGGWAGITAVKGGAASDTISGNNQTFNLTGINAGNNGAMNWSSFENLTDGTAGQFKFGTAGSVSGMLDGGGAGTLDYSNFTTAVNVGLGGTATATGGWTGITTANGGSASDTISGSGQIYNLTGANAGSSGTFGWTSFENIADTGTGTLSATNQAWSLTGHNQGTVSDLAGAFSGIGNLIDTGTGQFFMHVGADGDISGNLNAGTDGTLDYTGYTAPVNVNLSGLGSTGVGGTTSGVSVLTASSNLGVSGNASGNLTITTTGAGSGASLGATTVGGDLHIAATGPVSQSGGALTVAGISNIDAGTNAITLTDGGNDFTGVVTLNGGSTQINDINALSLGAVNSTTLSVISGDLTLGGAVVGTAVNLISSGAINEGAGGLITATTLMGSSANGTTLNNANMIGALGGFTASNFALVNAQSLTVTGPVDGGANTALTVTAGDLTVNGALSGAMTTLTSAGAISEGAGGVITAGHLNGSSVTSTTLNGANKIAALDSFTAANFALTNAQSLAVTGPVNGGASAALTTTAGDLSINGAVNGTTATLTSAGAINEGASGVITAATLLGGSVGNTTLNGANKLGALGSFTAANLALTNAQSLAITGPVNGGASTTLKITAGDLAINGGLTGTTTTLTSAGAISEGAGGVITAGTLKGSSAGSTTLNGANKIGVLGNFTAANLALTNAQSLTVSGPVNGGASTALTTTTGDLAINGGLTGTTTTLTSAGAINEGASGVITASTLKGSSTGNTALSGANKIGTLGSFTAANFALTNAQSLAIAGPVNGGASTTLTTTTGDLAINGAVSGSTTTLTSAGAISEGTGGVITADALKGSSVGNTTLNGANKIGAVGSFTAANLALTNAQSLAITGPVNGGASTTLTTTSGNLAINGGLTGTAINLASAGVISEGTSGVITASTLTGSSAGATTLNGANKVGVLGNFTAANFALTNAQSLTVAGPINGGANATLATTAGDLAVNGAVNGTTTTLTSAGAINEGASGVITANTLTGSSAGNATLNGANKVGVLGSFTAANLALTTTQSLAVVGPVNGGASAALTTTTGDLAINGALGGSMVTLTSAGAISEGSSGVITANTLKGSSASSTALNGANKVGALGSFTAANFALTNAQSLAVAGPVNGGASATLKTTTGNLAINGALSGSTITLTSTGAISEGASGVITANTLTGSSAGSTTLNGANKVGALGSFTAANFALSNAQSLALAGPVNGGASTTLATTAGDLAINGALSGTTVTLTSAAAISEGASGVITANTLKGSSAGGTTLNGANKVGMLGSFTAANFALTNAQSLALTGPVNGGTSTTLATTAGDLVINGALSGTTVTLISAAAINEGAGGDITAGLLTGSSVGNATLDGGNHIDRLGSFTSDFSLTNDQTLTVVGPLDGGPTVALRTTAGDLVINGAITGTTTTLTSAGAISEGAGGVITASTLKGSSVGSTTLNGANKIGTLGSFTAANLALTNAQSLTVSGPVSGGASTALTTTAGDLAINGAVSGTTTALTSAGAISEGTDGAITAGTLNGRSTGDTTLNGVNTIGLLGSFTAANFALTNAQSLAITGPVNGGANTTLKTTTGDLTINGALSGTTVTLTSAGALNEGTGGVITADTLTGSSTGATSLDGANRVGTLSSFNAANFGLTNAQTLTTSGPVNGGANTTLTTTAGDLAINGAVNGSKMTLVSAGAITEGSNGVITAGTLSGKAAGPTTLGSASGRVNNMVDTLGNFTSTAGFSMTNNKTLTLASVDGSAFTVNAGKSPTYLSVTNGDLFQTGLTPLYNSTGTWGSTGRMGKGSAAIQVIGVGIQTIANVGLSPAYFYAVDSNKAQLPLVGGFAINVPTAQGAGSAQNGNHGDSYIDPSVISANYRSYGIVPSGVRLPADQQSGCDPDQPDQEGCQDGDSIGMVRYMMNGRR